jgi:RHS repeat-associated protein
VNGKTATYDAENRLISLKGDGVDVVYTYDPDGNRIGKTDNIANTTTKYLVDTQNPTGYAQVVEELDATNTVQVVYTYGLDLISQNRHRIASYWDKTYYGYDGTGSVRYLMDGTGTVTDTYTYDAFGTMLEKTGTTTNAYLFQGEQFDETLGLYYLRARYMDPNLGRFATMDTFEGDNMDPRSLHMYAFVLNDPENLNDPTGYMATPLKNFVDYLQSKGLQVSTMAFGWQAHRLIEADIVLKFPGRAFSEVPVPGGIIDVYLMPEEIYEIKPYGGSADPARQISRYINSAKKEGRAYIPGKTPISGRIRGPYNLTTIEYATDEPGSIYYIAGPSDLVGGSALLTILASVWQNAGSWAQALGGAAACL